jgi:hypothetical protein
MKLYRKKPIVIEAVKWDGDNFRDVCNFTYYNSIGRTPDNGIAIETLEGIMTARLGDYIIKGIRGEFYPCKPDIFEATYEEIL